MRQLLDYEALPTWQQPPDLSKLSSAVDAALSQFWKDVMTVGLLVGLRHVMQILLKCKMDEGLL